jgi:hypothetical protein
MKKTGASKKIAKPQIGDLVEIGTPAGLAYVQYTHDAGTSGQIVRVLPGLYESRPTDLAGLVRQKELYFIFYPMEYPLRKELAKIVANEPVPEWAVSHPMMRLPVGRDYDLGRVLKWRIVSAANQLTVPELLRAPLLTELTAEQEKLSIRVIAPHAALVKDLARGWTPERAAELYAQDAAMRAEEKRLGPASDSKKPMQHYLYFSSSKHAEGAAECLRQMGYATQVELAPDGEKWLTLATKTPPSTGEQMAELRDELETLAIRFDGEYDGWELALGQTESASRIS